MKSKKANKSMPAKGLKAGPVAKGNKPDGDTPKPGGKAPKKR